MSAVPLPSDAELARQAVSGNARAFSALVTRHKAILYRFIRAYVGNADDAYDLLQQTFLSAWRAMDGFDPDRPMQTWLRAIARNKCRDHHRRTRLLRILTIPDWGAATRVPDARPTPEEAWIDAQGLRALNQAIAELPPALKEPLLLTALEKLSQAEAGRQLGISAKAVEMRVRRARQKLAAVLGG